VVKSLCQNTADERPMILSTVLSKLSQTLEISLSNVILIMIRVE